MSPFFPSSFRIQNDILQELAATWSQNGPVEMLCYGCGSHIEYESDRVAAEKNTDVTVEYVKKHICLQVHQSLLQREKE